MGLWVTRQKEQAIRVARRLAREKDTTVTLVKRPETVFARGFGPLFLVITRRKLKKR